MTTSCGRCNKSGDRLVTTPFLVASKKQGLGRDSVFLWPYDYSLPVVKGDFKNIEDFSADDVLVANNLDER